MKVKASDWNCTGGDAFAHAVSEQIRGCASDEIEMNLTPDGLEVILDGRPVDVVASVRQSFLDLLLASTSAVAQVEDPYAQTGVAYVVIGLDPCRPVIREVPKGTEHSYPTLVDAKEAARQIIQSSLAKASASLADLRQVGIERIAYISL